MRSLVLLTLFTLLSSSSASAKICGPRDALIPIFNRNAAQSVWKYNNTNHRLLATYEEILGEGFKARVHREGPLRYLDSGGGYSRAGLKVAATHSESVVTVINSQNNWDPIIQWKKKGYPFQSGASERTLLLGTLEDVGAKTEDLVTVGKSENLYSPGWQQKAIDRLGELYQDLTKAKRFNYRVGYAEKILPKLEEKFDLISDVYGPYYYSGSKAELLDQYYRTLDAEGEGYVVISTVDQFRVFGENGPERKIYPHGPKATVMTAEGEEIPFENYLVKKFPEVFEILKIGDLSKEGESVIQVLKIKKLAKVKSLDLTQALGSGKMSFPKVDDDFIKHLPTTQYRLKPSKN